MKKDFKSQLKEKRLSLTAVRLAVLEALDKAPHSDANQIFKEVEGKISTASLQSVYKNLSTLVEEGIVREIKPKGRPSLFETRTGDNHHHLVCRNCGGVQDTDCLGKAPCLTPSDSYGYLVDEAEVIFWGICPKCKNLN